MKKTSARTAELSRRAPKGAVAANPFTSGLQAFEIDALTACRGFQVAMAVNVFGVGTLLENNLPSH